MREAVHPLLNTPAWRDAKLKVRSHRNETAMDIRHFCTTEQATASRQPEQKAGDERRTRR